MGQLIPTVQQKAEFSTYCSKVSVVIHIKAIPTMSGIGKFLVFGGLTTLMLMGWMAEGFDADAENCWCPGPGEGNMVKREALPNCAWCEEPQTKKGMKWKRDICSRCPGGNAVGSHHFKRDIAPWYCGWCMGDTY